MVASSDFLIQNSIYCITLPGFTFTHKSHSPVLLFPALSVLSLALWESIAVGLNEGIYEPIARETSKPEEEKLQEEPDLKVECMVVK